MKHILIFKATSSIVFLLLTICVDAQNVMIDYNSTGTGRGITASYSKKNQNHELGWGLGFNINKLAHPDDQNMMYYKRLYATEPIHYLHANFYYHRYVFNSLKNLNPFLFYDLRLKYSTTRNRMLLPHSYDSSIVSDKPEEHILYVERIENFGPFTWVEQNIGLGYKIEIGKKVYIQQKIGAGTMFVLGHEDKILKKRFEWFEWEFAAIISVGVGLKLNKKTNPPENVDDSKQ